jgi:4-hydroxybenzoate polyprenyltransferase
MSDFLYLLQCFFFVSHFLPIFVLVSFRFPRVYYAQDKTDDAKIGMRSTALLFGERVRPILAGFGALTIGALCAAGAGGGCGPGTEASALQPVSRLTSFSLYQKQNHGRGPATCRLFPSTCGD